jgi:hypothetical protein
MAALAAGVATSMAQNVYSLNIVGYANVQLDQGFHAMSNPFDVGTNGANEVFPQPLSQWNDVQIQEWTGAGYNVTVFSDDTTVTTTGFANVNGNAQKPVPILSGGKGWLCNNPVSSNNVVFVGTVRTGTNTITVGTVPPLGAHQIQAFGSPIPYAGPITSLGFTNTAGSLNDVQIQILKTSRTYPDHTTGGPSAGYDVSVWSDDTTVTTTGFANVNGNAQKPEPIIPIAGGFLIFNPNANFNWVQILNP